MKRRQFTGLAGTGIVLALAGCTGDDENGDGTDNGATDDGENGDETDTEDEETVVNSATDPVEAWYIAIGDGDAETLLDLLHSESPARDEIDGEDDLEPTEVTVVDLSVEFENPSGETIREELAAVTEDPALLDDMVAVAETADESAIVYADIEFAGNGEDVEFTAPHLTAIEGSEWVMIG